MRLLPRDAGFLVLALQAGAWAVMPTSCGAEAADGGAPAWIQEITLHGFLSSSYSYNFNRPPSGTNQFRVFDFDDDAFKLDEFELVAQKEASRPREAGFRVDLTLGSSVPRVTASAGLFRDDTGKAGDIDIHQAFARFVVPVGPGIRLDAGKFITSHGYEVIDGYDGWNDNATRSLLFGYAIPFTHVGIRASYAMTKRLSGTAMLVNGWDVARDNNRGKSVGAQIAWTPGDALTVVASGMTGPERAGDSDPRSLLDLVAILSAGGRLTLGVNGDWGREGNAVAPGQDGEWSGAALYARVSVTKGFAVSVRGETFLDLDGVRTGVPQRLRELTLTPEVRLAEHLRLRGDLRVDHSSRRVFEKSSGLVKTQPTTLIEALYFF